MRRATRLGIGAVIGATLLLSACSSDDDEGSSSETTEAATDETTDDAAAGTDTTMGSDGSTVDTAGTTTAALPCDELTPTIEEAYGSTMSLMEDLGGSCTATLENGFKVEVLWNAFATDEGTFATITADAAPAEVAGADTAMSLVDESGATVFVLVPGEGSYEISAWPDYASGEVPTEADLEGVTAVAEQLLAG